MWFSLVTLHGQLHWTVRSLETVHLSCAKAVVSMQSTMSCPFCRANCIQVFYTQYPQSFLVCCCVGLDETLLLIGLNWLSGISVFHSWVFLFCFCFFCPKWRLCPEKALNPHFVFKATQKTCPLETCAWVLHLLEADQYRIHYSDWSRLVTESSDFK